MAITVNAQVSVTNRRGTQYVPATEYFDKPFEQLTKDELSECSSISIFASNKSEVAEAQSIAQAVATTLQFAGVEEPRELKSGIVVNVRKRVATSASTLLSILHA